jgi:hypothetical protein
MLAIGDWTAVRLWDVRSRKERQSFRLGHGGEFQGVAFAADGRAVFSCSRDTTLLVWDATGARAGVRPPAALADPDLEALWTELKGADAKQAFGLVGTLVGAPGQAVPFLKKELRPVPPADTAQVARWLADLDSDAFETRRAAARELEKLGDSAESQLRLALRGKPSAEVRRTLEQLLPSLGAGAERERTRRALEVLKYVGTPEAAQVLKALAAGAPDAWLTREAREALGRVERYPAKRRTPAAGPGKGD